eukprot:TRINITY_DN11760_c0_g1_i5.p1 TRINITY_DN11760_c0_g1~~TRINITY_DN11760_c0_g1_i5.p1  ORF type:complete len:223 (+),score=35.38 TRINITY_DN11760_c0_g1_i5:28-669(+)
MHATSEKGWDEPLIATVTTEVVNHNPGPFTATMADQTANTLLKAGGYEPFMIRRKYVQETNATDRIEVDANELCEYNSFVDGLLDGGSVRVYRVVNGSVQRVRNDTVAKFRCLGWNSPNSGDLIAADTTTYYDNEPSWYRPNSTLYFAVAAVDNNGNVSAPSKWISLPLPPTVSGNAKSLNKIVNPKTNMPPNATVPPVPENLKVHNGAEQSL